MIRIENLTCGYGAGDVLKDVSLSVKKGEMAAILGPNGSGKTTLVSCISGVIPPRSGDVQISGRSVSRLSARERAQVMAVVPQKADAIFGLRCLTVVLMGRYSHASFLGGYSDDDKAAALSAMTQTGTLKFAERSVDRISGGEFKRVLIARALAQETGLLLLDEATAGLDIAGKVRIYDLLRHKCRTGTTALSVMHDLNLAALYCDRLIFLKNGRVIQMGPTAEVFNEKSLSDIYETDVRVAPHPATGAPQAHFVPGSSAYGI